MNQRLKSILIGLATILFIVVMAGALAAVGFVLLTIAMYYTILLVLNYGFLAGLAAIVALIIVIVLLMVVLLKKIRKG